MLLLLLLLLPLLLLPLLLLLLLMLLLLLQLWLTLKRCLRSAVAAEDWPGAVKRLLEFLRG